MKAISQMTRRRYEILTFINKYKEENIFGPTYRQIGIAIGISPTTVFEHVSKLVKTGFLSKQAPYYKGGIIQGLFITDKGKYGLVYFAKRNL